MPKDAIDIANDAVNKAHDHYNKAEKLIKFIKKYFGKKDTIKYMNVKDEKGNQVWYQRDEKGHDSSFTMPPDKKPNNYHEYNPKL